MVSQRVFTLYWVSWYTSRIMATYCSGIPFVINDHHIKSLGTLSYDFSKSTHTIYRYFPFSLFFSCSMRKANIGSVVDLPFLNPNWTPSSSTICLILWSMIRSYNFMVCAINLIPLYFSHQNTEQFPFHSGDMSPFLHDWGIPSTSTSFIVCRR